MAFRLAEDTDVTEQAAANGEGQPCPCTTPEAAGKSGPEGMTIAYEGKMHAICRKESTGCEVAADGTTACGGSGEHLSPIDLFASAYGSCVLMATEMSGRRQGLELAGSRVRVVVTMAKSGTPNIQRVDTTLLLPRAAGDVERESLSRGANGCPIHNALASRVKQTLTAEAQPESS